MGKVNKDTVILSAQQLDHLADVIQELELKTAGEIRLMIVGRSSTIGHVWFQIWTLLTGMTALIFWLERDFFIFHADVWFWPVILLVYYFAAIQLAKLPGLQRLFIPRDDMESQVWSRAELEFQREGLNQTQGRTGILLFLSLMEHQAVVIGDKPIAAKLQQSTWDEVIDLVLVGGKTGDWVGQLEKALRLCGGVMATHFPIGTVDHNELSNLVIVKD